MNALSDDPIDRSGILCKYCPGRNCCKKRAADVMEVVRKIKSPELMKDEEIEAILPKLDDVMDYCEDIKAYCLKKAVENGKIKELLVLAGYDKKTVNKLTSVFKLVLEKRVKKINCRDVNNLGQGRESLAFF